MKPAKLIYTQEAENDLNSISDYIARNSVENALRYIDKMKSRIEKIALFPHMGIDCRTKGIERDCRIYIFENYLIFYQVNNDNNEIKILRILHGSRQYHKLSTCA